MARIFVTRRLPFPALERLTAHGHEVDVWEDALPPPRDELIRRTAYADALLCMLTDRIDADFLDHTPDLQAISVFAVGTDNVDLEVARVRGIPVGNTPDVLTEATADLTFALLLAAARRLPEAARAVRDGGWRTWEPAGWLGHDVHGATIGVIGFGRIGEAVAHRAHGFGMHILHTPDTPLDTLLAEADFVTVHVPLTPRTHHLIGEAALACMKPTSILINTSRGPVVDQQALVRALDEGSIAAAALDVTDPEPPPPGDPVLDTPNLLLVPHIGSATHGARERMAELAVENLLAALSGAPMPHAVVT